MSALLGRMRGALAPVGGMLVVDQLVGQIRVEVAVEWLPYRGSKVESYANIERTTEGGTHVQGLIGGLVEALREAVPAWKTRPRKKLAAAVSRGLHAVVCVRLNDPTYGAPTRSRLMTPEAKSAVSSAVRTAFTAFVQSNAALLEHFAGDS